MDWGWGVRGGASRHLNSPEGRVGIGQTQTQMCVSRGGAGSKGNGNFVCTKAKRGTVT